MSIQIKSAWMGHNKTHLNNRFSLAADNRAVRQCFFITFCSSFVDVIVKTLSLIMMQWKSYSMVSFLPRSQFFSRFDSDFFSFKTKKITSNAVELFYVIFYIIVFFFGKSYDLYVRKCSSVCVCVYMSVLLTEQNSIQYKINSHRYV